MPSPSLPWTLLLSLVLFFLEAVVTRFRRCFGGTATTTRVSTLTPLEAVPPALPALPPSSPPLAASRVLLVPSVGPAMGVMLLALLVAFLVAMMPLPVKTGFLRCFAGTDRVSPWWRAARMATGNGTIVEMRAKTHVL